MKKFLLGSLLTVLFAVPVLAHPPISVFVEGTEIAFDQPPVIQNDRTLVPMRGIFEAMGATVSWDEPAQSVTAIQGEDTILFYVGKQELYKNGEMIYAMPIPAQLVNDRLLVPLRAIAYGLGAEVSWDGTLYEVHISAKDTTVSPKEPEETPSAPQIPTEPEQSVTVKQEPTFSENATERMNVLRKLTGNSQQELEQLWLAGFGALLAAEEDVFYADAQKRLQQNLHQVEYYLTEDGIGFSLAEGILAPKEAGTISFEVQYPISGAGIS